MTLDWDRWRDAPHTIRFQIGDWPSRPLLREADRARGPAARVRDVRRPPGRARCGVTRRGRPADVQLAGLQLLRRRRRRLGRHLVRRPAAPERRPRPARTCTEARRRSSTATTRASCTGSTGRARPSTSSPSRTSRRSRETSSPAPTTWSSIPGTPSTSPGHEYDAVERYRDLGGNLIFLSSNNFFRRVDRVRRGAAQDRPVAEPRPPRGAPARRAVPDERRGRAPGPVRRSKRRSRPLALGRAPASPTGRPSARRSAGTGSRSTTRPPTPRRGRSCSRRSPTCSARA